MISTNRIEEAKSFFDDIYRSENNIDIKRNINGLLKKIRSAEIGDLVVRAIKARSTEKDDAQFYREIKKGIEQKSLSLETIELGRSRDGLKKISLSDVWPEKRELKR